MPTLRLLPEFEDELKRLPGIIAASVVTGPDAVPTEVHVLADRGKPAKQVVRDVQSLAMARYDLDIDHRIVSVVQIGADEFSPSRHPARRRYLDRRPRWRSRARPSAPSSRARRTTGPEAEAPVTLAAIGGHVFEGRVAGPRPSPPGRRLVARATLNALEELLGSTADVELDGDRAAAHARLR